MSEILHIGGAVALAAMVLWGIVWVVRDDVRREREEQEEFLEAISHLPALRQAELLMSKLRHDAQKDLW